MRSFLKLLSTTGRHGLRSVFTLFLWTLWLGLGLLLAFQAYILTVQEFEIPPHILRGLEQRFAGAGLNASFGRTRFDPSGHILIEEVRARIPGFSEPIAIARALSARVNPWALLFGEIDELELSVTGLTLFVPAMLSASGRVEEFVRDLDGTFVVDGRHLTIRQLTGRIGILPITAQGALELPPRRTTPSGPPVGDFFSKNYGRLSREISTLAARLTLFEEPRLRLDLAPSETHLAFADVSFTAQATNSTSPAVQTGPIALTTRIPLQTATAQPVELTVATERLQLPQEISARGVNAQLHGTLDLSPFEFSPRDAEIVAEDFRVGPTVVSAPVLRLAPGPLPSLQVALTTTFAGQPMNIDGRVNWETRTAEAGFSGRVDDGLLAIISQRIRRDVRQWIDFPEPVTITSGHVIFSSGWKWEKLNARLVVPVINAYHVQLTDGRVALELTPKRLYAPEAFGRIGDNFARGSYDHDPANHRYRFLLEGRLRPLDISGWFGEWWPDFFKQLVFPAAIPEASVEVAGRWGRNTGGESRVIVSGNAVAPEIFGAKFDRGRVHLVIRPHFLDALSFSGTLGAGEAHGSFSRRLDAVTLAPQTIEFNVTSTLDPTGPAKMFGAAGAELLAPFAFEQPPALTVRGRLDTEMAPGGAHDRVDVKARTNAPFRFHDFPFRDASLDLSVRDDVLTLESVDAGIADGRVQGRSKVWGRGAERRLGFDYQLENASLGLVIAMLENRSAAKKNAPPPPPNRFLTDKSSLRLKLSASAEGAFDDPLSYAGSGSATISGGELGEVKLLGQLSDLFSFTALRFTAGRANFRIERRRLLFSDVSLTGSNSAINAHGTYALDRRELDFNAKIFPFQESELGFKSIFGAVLAPLSNVFEVKLSGSLEHPDWRFVMGPTNFFRALGQGAGSGEPAPAPAPPPAPAPKP